MSSTIKANHSIPKTLTQQQQELQRRMRGPQRHRLLQGYPMPPLMVNYNRTRPYEPVKIDASRPLIVGVLPHAACNPSVQGCGYCTFPHEQFRASEVGSTVEAVMKEIASSELTGRAVDALYFGGGTANLTPPDQFQQLCSLLGQRFQLDQAEVTLEGAPVYFTARKEALLQALEEMPVQSRRLSMGVQTFDQELLERMGRQALGNLEAVRRAVEAAQRRGMTTSADLMINMPGQTLEEMKADVRRASDLGFSQICVYHLVLFRGLGTPWSRDRDMLGSLPDNETAFENWLEVRELVLELGYQQKTLTNFEREGHYRYEECSYRPELYDGVGFGPEALSCFTDQERQTAVKWMNESYSADYRSAIGKEGEARSKVFVYGETDLKILFLTRTLPRLEVSRGVYRTVFGSELLNDFGPALQALKQSGLVKWNDQSLRLTTRGMFFADSVAGLLAADRVVELRRGVRAGLNDPPVFRMG